MVRTIISLDPEDKRWLDQKAKQDHVTMTAVVRQAIRLLKESSESNKADVQSLLEETQGLWRHGDGLEYLNQLRREW